jgi:hypothetical protein
MKSSSWSIAVVLLICSTLVISCSQAPPEPASEFTLPVSRVTTAPPTPAEPTETGSAPSRLRYVAVPPGQHVAGMAHAHIVVKQRKATRHRLRHTRKKAASPAAAVRVPTETTEPAAKH